ncbi:MAG: hypothetical protein WC629_02335 [Candidatus Paceibacterota bacterium]|jgi:hypothetical protein
MSIFTLFLIITVVGIILFWLNAFTILYHLIRFGIGTRPKQASLIFLIGSLVLFVFAITTIVGLILNVPPILQMPFKNTP